ncbi:hypothetical protein KV112_20655 [Mycolicibacter sp. MYC123]|uniref:DUF222 domain-containing protein n=1 Tax=[Mycobacterium] zoologicum TaxID=2872311 RepID=A0ABU5YT45_9MYCO|nr:hypothetical protein [Mycolicibacter sp. MYC123]MEB3052124.1 hypothetical protein [Mycolicibacter sp. MYC123]
MDLPADRLADTAARVTLAALQCARVAAAEQVIDSMKAGAIPITTAADVLADVFARRDTNDPTYQAVAPYEQTWALLVVRITDAANRTPPLADAQAVADARQRGASWQAIGDALGGLSMQAAHGRYAARADVASRRRRPR